MTPDEVASAGDAVRTLVGDDVARLLSPELRAEHAPVVEALGQLPWKREPAEVVVEHALHVLQDATTPGGVVDPAHDDADVPWTVMLGKIGTPAIASRTARRWFAYLERLLRDGVHVSTVPTAIAAYAVARFEADLGHAHETWWWLQLAACQSEIDERSGLALVVTVRAARLLTWRPS